VKRRVFLPVVLVVVSYVTMALACFGLLLWANRRVFD